MPLRPEDVPSDPARLVALVLALDTENERLRAIVRTLKDLLFGARSERAAVIAVDQLPLDLDDLAVGPTPPPLAANDEGVAERKLKRPRRPAVRNIGALPKHLPRCEEVIEPETTVCPCCSGALHRIGAETREALDVVPAFVRVKRTIFPKYACRTCEGAIVQAKSPPRLVRSWRTGGSRWTRTRLSEPCARLHLVGRMHSSPAVRAGPGPGRSWQV